jgi:LysR family transcriptional regulator for bpeEF and oprC
MDTLQAMRVFARVVEAGGFARAGDSTGLGTPTVSRLVQTLEARLGCKLLNRTTRKISLTDDGRAYYERCVGVLGEIDDMEASLSEAKATPKGRVRISLPIALAKAVVIPGLPDFVAQYPEIQVELGLTDRDVDLVEEGVDCVVRAGTLDDSGLVARKIGSLELCMCATPGYLARHGEPKTLDDLDQHVGVTYLSSRTGRPRMWSFLVDGEVKTVPVRGSVTVNDAEALITCALAGLGLVKTSRHVIEPYLQSGQLQRVLAAFDEPPRPISVLYMPNRNLPNKVRVVIDWLASLFEKSSAR